MKQLILSVFVLSLAAAAQAQDQPATREPNKDRSSFQHRGRHHGMDMKALNLTADQQAKLKTQNENFRQQMEQLRKKEGATAEERKSAFQKMREEHRAAFNQVLTEEQRAQLEKMRAANREKRSEMGKRWKEKSGDRATAMKDRSNRMKEALALTDAQSSSLAANRKEMGEKMKAIRENKSLSDEQKKEQMKDLMKGQKEKMKSILTEEQLKKMKEMHQRGRGDKDRQRSDVKSTTL